jgi:hypothetical protein
MTEKIIVKKDNNGNLIMFFPECRNNDYTYDAWHTVSDIATIGYCHGSASKEYIYKCTHVDYLDIDVIKFVTNYVKYIRTLPDMADYAIKLYKRISR